jgi:hypothetical protein
MMMELKGPGPKAEQHGLVVELPAMVRRPDDQVINVMGAALNYTVWGSFDAAAHCSAKNSPGEG